VAAPRLYGDEKIVLVEYAKPSGGHPLAWGTLGVGILGLLYFLFRGREGSGGRRESGFGPGLPMPLPTPIPRDPSRLTFVMLRPTAGDPHESPSFRGPDGKMFSLDEMIARVRAGGRSDVAFTAAGDVRQGSIDAAKAHIQGAGIQVWENSSTKSVGRSIERGYYR
jgi:hypothetical protein